MLDTNFSIAYIHHHKLHSQNATLYTSAVCFEIHLLLRKATEDGVVVGEQQFF
jgi:hypothetical protein